MDPSLIPKFLTYCERKKANTIKKDPKTNDTGITVEDIQSNDVWCICFQVLFSYNSRFAACYTYAQEKNDWAIRFNVGLFKDLFIKTLREFEFDRTFTLVLTRLCKIERFNHVIKRGPSKSSFKPNKQSLRDLKYYIWLLTYSQFPHHKIQSYERGEPLREVDECATLGSNDSLYCTSSEELPLESIVFRSETRKQINQLNMRMNRARSPVDSIKEESAEGESSCTLKESEAAEDMQSDLNHSLKVNNLNQPMGGDFSYSFEQSEDLTTEETPVPKRNGWIEYLIQNYPQEGKRTKGLLSLESEMKLVKKMTILDQLRQARRTKKEDSGVQTNMSDKHKREHVWKQILALHRDTGNTKEFSDIKFKFNPISSLESIPAKTVKTDWDDCPTQNELFLPIEGTKINFADKPSQPIMRPPEQFNSRIQKPPKLNKNSSDFRSNRDKIPKRRPSRSVSRKRLPKTKRVSPSPNTTMEFQKIADDKLIESLQKMSKIRVDSLTSADFDNHGENLFDTDAKSTHNEDNGHCKCKLCANASRSRSRRGSYRSRKSFDSRRSAEEIMEDRRQNRKRRSSRSVKKKKEPRFEDPYQGKKLRPSKNQFAKHDHIFKGKEPPRKMKRNASGYLKKPQLQVNSGSYVRSGKSRAGMM